MANSELDADIFYDKFEQLFRSVVKNRKNVCLSVQHGRLQADAANHNDRFPQCTLFHLWMFGHQIPDSIFLIMPDGRCFFVAEDESTLQFLQPAVGKERGSIKNLFLLGASEIGKCKQVLEEASSSLSEEDGTLEIQVLYDHNSMNYGIVFDWMTALTNENDPSYVVKDAMESVSRTRAIKNNKELAILRVGSNICGRMMDKVFKFVKDFSKFVSPTSVSEELDEEIENVREMHGRDVTQESGVRVCAPGAAASDAVLIVSFGVRYKMYCSRIGRSILLDAPEYVRDAFIAVSGLQEQCLTIMRPGMAVKEVHKAAYSYLKTVVKMEHLADKLPASLGVSIGLEIGDGNISLSKESDRKFCSGMVFELRLLFEQVEARAQDVAAVGSNSQPLLPFTLLLSDMVCISTHNAEAEILTRCPALFEYPSRSEPPTSYLKKMNLSGPPPCSEVVPNGRNLDDVSDIGMKSVIEGYQQPKPLVASMSGGSEGQSSKPPVPLTSCAAGEEPSSKPPVLPMFSVPEEPSPHPSVPSTSSSVRELQSPKPPVPSTSCAAGEEPSPKPPVLSNSSSARFWQISEPPKKPYDVLKFLKEDPEWKEREDLTKLSWQQFRYHFKWFLGWNEVADVRAKSSDCRALIGFLTTIGLFLKLSICPACFRKVGNESQLLHAHVNAPLQRHFLQVLFFADDAKLRVYADFLGNRDSKEFSSFEEFKDEWKKYKEDNGWK